MRYAKLGLAIALVIAAAGIGACRPKKTSSSMMPLAHAATAAKPAAAAPAAAKAQQTALHGTVSRVDAKREWLTIRWQTQEKDRKGKLVTRAHWQTIGVKPTTRITLKGKSVKLSQVKVGSTVDVTAQKTGHKMTAASITIVKEPAKPAPKKAATTRAKT
jgi:hypothetical protein